MDAVRNRKPVKTVQQDMLDVVMLRGADQYVALPYSERTAGDRVSIYHGAPANTLCCVYYNRPMYKKVRLFRKRASV